MRVQTTLLLSALSLPLAFAAEAQTPPAAPPATGDVTTAITTILSTTYTTLTMTVILNPNSLTSAVPASTSAVAAAAAPTTDVIPSSTYVPPATVSLSTIASSGLPVPSSNGTAGLSTYSVPSPSITPAPASGAPRSLASSVLALAVAGAAALVAL